MKLILCPDCNDVVRLIDINRTCRCGNSWGWYEQDGKNGHYRGSAIPLGFANPDILDAIRRWPEKTSAIRVWVDTGKNWHGPDAEAT